MMESIEIKNFGPIKHVKLDLKDINVFIGTTGSGKSTVAKLVAIFRNVTFIKAGNLETFKRLLVDYNINYTIKQNTYAFYQNRHFYWKLEKKVIETNYPFENLIAQIYDWGKWFARGAAKDVSERKIAESRLLFAAMANLDVGGQTMLSRVKDTHQRDRLSEIMERSKKLMNRVVYGDGFEIDEIDKLLEEVYVLIVNETGSFISSYIPAERSLLSTITESIYGLLSNDVAIARILSDFGADFEYARRQYQKLVIDILKATYEFENSANLITLEDGVKIKLENASSGFQSLVPLLLVIYAKTNTKNFFEQYIIVEEPELNLYPTVQKDLMEFIVERINKSGDKLIITTHSPYVLTTLDNLIQADNTVKRNPGAEEKVKEMVPPERWVDFDRVTCYYFKDGKCHSTLDKEFRSIGPSNIDDVSDDIGKTYDELLALEYANVS